MKFENNLSSSRQFLVGSDEIRTYLECLSSLERLHRLLLDIVKDEFERIGLQEINPVQALLLFHMGEQEMTAGELRSRGYYQGSNVSYNLKKLVESGYLHYERSLADRRSVRVRLTEKGRKVRELLERLFVQQSDKLRSRALLSHEELQDLLHKMKTLETFWGEQIRYIY